ncbi:MAG: hypothetical protein LLG00_07460 [Planctomycetaceae bacterium]|nr:hypothetical protein [Planctomycetaceae bacterium]
MQLDIRIPIGLMFGVVGLILVVFGGVSDKLLYARSLGYNVNLIWGCVLVVFSAFMLGMAWHARKRQP